MKPKSEAYQRVIAAAEKMRSDFVTAIAMRDSLCRNSDVENEAGNPANWDKTLMQWIATLAAYDKAKQREPETRQKNDRSPD